jgi:hypothetical protein
MGTVLIALLVVSALVWLWSDARTAHERASTTVRALLRGTGAQLLDQTVVLERMRLGRTTRGRMVINRTYSFDISCDGFSRESGRLTLTGDSVQVLDLPEGASRTQGERLI